MADAKLPIVDQDVPYPKPWGVLLAQPNPDGSRKTCGNCMMWVRTDQCAIHDPGLPVSEEHICGYHVYGQPMDEWMDHPGIQPVNPEYSGLEHVPGGTSCDICIYYEQVDDEMGMCHQVADPEIHSPPVPVSALQCCAAWDDGQMEPGSEEAAPELEGGAAEPGAEPNTY